jgi:hypothetical protein
MLNCYVCITADTPHQGDSFGGILNSIYQYAPQLVVDADPIKPYQEQQVKNMDPIYSPMQLINQLDNRQLFLSRVNKFYQFKGLRDWIVMDSSLMDKTGIEDIYKQKVINIQVEGCEHIGTKCITLDPRTVLAIIYMLLDIKIDLGFNYGNFPGGVDITPDESTIFV